ncbi:MAG: tRNA delta(2)-isopentenylpyrophosphate transferase [Hyphomicrobium sp. 32-62-53]|nr:MAG: tRNA delta(2)-isopentenylpyrophosphate transferase [Hyphomicrobium sp. 12-62-95]OYX97753.1 MAG: tRNA delta(2)-isopentenylpyrophosphate transferase [Hyphomicrobium sp. 32-62-53]
MPLVTPLKARARGWAAIVVMALTAFSPAVVPAQDLPEVDTALVISVDVSNSVDATRYQLQLEGIAKALEDEAVIEAILTGGRGSILLSLVMWADKPKIMVPWTKIGSKEEALALAALVRKLPREEGEFTCMSGMMRMIADKVVTQIPAQATRIVVDVSGDGKDNCNREEPVDVVRDELVASGVIINGLPILEGDGPTLEGWYRDYVVGGTGAFVLPAKGFADFGNAIRQKFVIEISGIPPPSKYAKAD